MWIGRLLYEILGWFLSIPDRLFPLLSWLGGPKFFSKGYGTPRLYFDRRTSVLKGLTDGTYELKRKDAELVEAQRDNTIVMLAGQFTSPVALVLPEASRTCYYQLIEPTHKKQPNVYIIMFPSTGEMGRFPRRFMAKTLAIKHRWSSIIMTAPYYGKRKPPTQRLFFLETVSGILLQSQAIIEEGLLLTAWILNRNKDALVCHTGFSFGASMACCTSAMCLAAGLEGSRIACAPYVGSASPNVLAKGAFESIIDWSALNRTKNANDNTPRKQLFDLLDETQLSTVAQHAKPDNLLAVARGMAFSNDEFVRPIHSKASEVQLSSMVSAPVQMQWYPGGHVFAALSRIFLQRKLLEEVVQELLSTRNK